MIVTGKGKERDKEETVGRLGEIGLRFGEKKREKN
jgi:hypothetical protein